MLIILLQTFRKYPYQLILLLITLCNFLLYYQGVNGPFLYDDESNLSALGWDGGIKSYNDAISFIFSNHSGPLGRPISMASFLLNSTNWPVSSYNFKLTNIIIHILCGWFIFLFTNKLLALSKDKLLKDNSLLIALMTSTYWLMHPLHVSTTLYTIQRMTQLSTLFTLMALVSYLFSIKTLANSNKINDFILPSLTILFITTLAVLSKENAILIFPAILCISWFISTPTNTRLYKIWHYLLTYIPLGICLFFLIINDQIFSVGYEFKQFDMTERLLTEFRVLCDYIGQLIIPNINSMTLFHDDIYVSKSITDPSTTLLATSIIIALIAALFTKLPKLFKFSIAWFFIWHLLESTILPLDLYFEHRNYLASLGPLLAISYMFIIVGTKFRHSGQKTSILLTSIYGLFLLYNLSILTNLWSDEEEMHMHWLVNHEKSKTTFLSLVQYYEKTGQLPLAHNLTNKGIEFPQFDHDLGIYLKLYTQQCVLHKGQAETVEQLKSLTKDVDSYNQTVLPLYTSLILTILNGNCLPNDLKSLHIIIANITNTAPQKINKVWLSDILSKQGYLYLYFGKLQMGVKTLENAYLYNRPNIAIAIIDNYLKLSNFEKAEYWLNVAKRHNKLRETGATDYTPTLDILYNRLLIRKEELVSETND